jgi:hypothetical protein
LKPDRPVIEIQREHFFGSLISTRLVHILHVNATILSLSIECMLKTLSRFPLHKIKFANTNVWIAK